VTSSQARSYAVSDGLAAALLAALAALFRLWNLGKDSLWFDELCTWRFASYDTVSEVVRFGSFEDVHPPGYQVFMHYWMRLFGDSEVALRLPSAIGGVLTTLLIYLLGRRLAGRNAAALAALLFAVMVPPITYGQEARHYSLLMALAALSVVLWLLLAQRAPGRRAWLGVTLVVTMAAMAYWHYSGLLLAVLELGYAAFVALGRREFRRTALTVSAAFAALYAPWIPGILAHARIRETIAENQLPNVPWEQIGQGLLGITFSPSMGLALAFLAVMLLSLVAASKAPGAEAASPRGVRVLWLWALGPLAAYALISIAWQPMLSPRYVSVSWPAFYLLAAIGLGKLPLKPIFQGLAAAALAGLVGYEAQAQRQYFTAPQKDPWRETVLGLIQNTPAEGKTVLIELGLKRGLVTYYLKRFESSLRPMSSLVELTPEVLRETQDRLLAEDPDYVWSFTGQLPPPRPFHEFLAGSFEAQGSIVNRGASAILYKRKG
jgi:mannosyltransferase